MKPICRAFSTASSGSRSIGLTRFRDSLAKVSVPGHEATVNTINSTSSPLPFSVVSRLFGAVVGVEGKEVFPTVLKSSHADQWSPSSTALERVQHILEKSKEHAVEDIVSIIREDSRVGNKGMLKQRNAASFAGWRYTDDQWVQYQGVADLCFFGLSSPNAREDVYRFADLPVSALTPQELQSLGTVNTQRSVVFRTPTPVHYHSLAVFNSNPNLVESHSSDTSDSHALLYSASSLLNQAMLHDFDEVRTAYSMTHTGRTWRFVAFQLNNMIIKQSHNANTVANAAWVYESELFHRNNETGKPVVNPEALVIMHDILQASTSSS